MGEGVVVAGRDRYSPYLGVVEFGKDNAVFVAAEDLDVLRVDIIGALATDEPVLGSHRFERLHGTAEHIIFDAVAFDIAHNDIVFAGLDTQDSGRGDDEFEFAGIVVETHEGFVINRFIALASDKDSEGEDDIGEAEDEEEVAQAVAHCRKISISAMGDEGHIEAGEEGGNDSFGHTPEGVEHPVEAEKFAQHKEEIAEDGQNRHEDGGDHQEVKDIYFLSGTKKADYRLGLIEEHEDEEEEGQADVEPNLRSRTVEDTRNLSHKRMFLVTFDDVTKTEKGGFRHK